MEYGKSMERVWKEGNNVIVGHKKRRGKKKERAKQEQIMVFVPHEKDIENLYNKAPLQTTPKSTSLRPVTLFIPLQMVCQTGISLKRQTKTRGRPRFHSRDRMTKSDPDRGQEGEWCRQHRESNERKGWRKGSLWGWKRRERERNTERKGKCCCWSNAFDLLIHSRDVTERGEEKRREGPGWCINTDEHDLSLLPEQT